MTAWWARWRHAGVPQHAVPATELARCAPPAGWGGLVLGFVGGRPIPVRIFRTEQTRVVTSNVDVARIVAVRALAVGTDVRIGTSRPAAWAPIARLAYDGTHRVTVVNGPVRSSRPGTVHTPVLAVRDAVGAGRREGVSTGFGDTGQIPVVRLPGAGLPGAWTARLTVVRDPGLPGSVPLLAAADLAVLDRLEPDHAARVASALGAPSVTARLVSRLEPGWVLLVARGEQPVAVEVRPTPLERQILGLGSAPVTAHA